MPFWVQVRLRMAYAIATIKSPTGVNAMMVTVLGCLSWTTSALLCGVNGQSVRSSMVIATFSAVCIMTLAGALFASERVATGRSSSRS